MAGRTAHVWTDGSRSGQFSPAGTLAAGGWAAIVEKGSEGWTCRGGCPKTTNMRMELVAMIEGLASLPAGCIVILHTDCTIALHVRQAWRNGLSRRNAKKAKDGDLWALLIDEFVRLDVGIDLVAKRDRINQHSRAHLIAREEAIRAGGHVAVPRLSKAARREMVASEQVPGWDGRRYGHVRGCTAARCVDWCPLDVYVRSLA